MLFFNTQRKNSEHSKFMHDKTFKGVQSIVSLIQNIATLKKCSALSSEWQIHWILHTYILLK